MENKELNVIVGLFTGVQTAIVHICNIISKGDQDIKKGIAESFRGTAEKLPRDITNRDIIGLVLNQIAEGLDGHPKVQDPAPVVLRLIRGSKP